MTKEQILLLSLIKNSQFGLDEDIVSADNVDWNDIYCEAKVQSVLGLVINDIPDDKIAKINENKHISIQQTASYVRYLHAETNLKDLLYSAGIPFVILKGNAAAIYYKDPSKRAMGDIDFIVPQNKFEKSQELLLENGYVITHFMNQDDRHIVFCKSGFLFELHHHYSHEDIDIEDYIIDGINNSVMARINEHEFPMLPTLANGLVLLDHMRSHLKGGLGLRQIIDWMMYVNKELDDTFWNEKFGIIAKEKGLDLLAIVTTRMCQMYMGLSDSITWCSEAEEETCNDLMEVLLMSGNFGRKHGKGGDVESASTRIKHDGLFRWLQKAGEHNWKAYKKHHWLKPFCWIYQSCRYMRKGFAAKRSSKQLRDDINRSKRRAELLTKLGI